MDICHLKSPFSLKLAPQAVIIVGAYEKSHSLPPTSCTPPCNLAMQNYVVSGILFCVLGILVNTSFVFTFCVKKSRRWLFAFYALIQRMFSSTDCWASMLGMLICALHCQTGRTIQSGKVQLETLFLLVMKFLGWCV